MDLNIEPGKILISEPFLEDPNFNRTVVLITEHSAEGTVGFVLNQRTDMTVDLLIPELDMVHNPVYQGGPVEIESFHFFHNFPEIRDSVNLMDGLFWSGDFEQVARGILEEKLDLKNFKFFIGYSGWAPGQLQDEIDQQAWIIGDISPDIILNDSIDNKKLWQRVMKELGGDYALLSNPPANPQYN